MDGSKWFCVGEERCCLEQPPPPEQFLSQKCGECKRGRRLRYVPEARLSEAFDAGYKVGSNRLDAATELLRRLPGLLSDEGCGQFATCEEWNEALLALVADTAAFLGDDGKEGR